MKLDQAATIDSPNADLSAIINYNSSDVYLTNKWWTEATFVGRTVTILIKSTDALDGSTTTETTDTFDFAIDGTGGTILATGMKIIDNNIYATVIAYDYHAGTFRYRYRVGCLYSTDGGSSWNIEDNGINNVFVEAPDLGHCETYEIGGNPFVLFYVKVGSFQDMGFYDVISDTFDFINPYANEITFPGKSISTSLVYFTHYTGGTGYIKSYDGSSYATVETLDLPTIVARPQKTLFWRQGLYDFLGSDRFFFKRLTVDTNWSVLSYGSIVEFGPAFIRDSVGTKFLSKIVSDEIIYHISTKGSSNIIQRSFTGEIMGGVASYDEKPWFADGTDKIYQFQPLSTKDGVEAVKNWSNIHSYRQYHQGPTYSLVDWSQTNQWNFRDFVIMDEDDGTIIFEGFANIPDFNGTSRDVSFFNPAVEDLLIPVDVKFTGKTAAYIIKYVIDTYCNYIYYTTASISSTPTAVYTEEFTGTVGDVLQWADEQETYKGTHGITGLYTWNDGTDPGAWDWKKASVGILPGVVDWGTWDDPDYSLIPDLTGSEPDTKEIVNIIKSHKNVLYIVDSALGLAAITVTESSTITIEAWLYPTESVANDGILISCTDDPLTATRCGFRLDGGKIYNRNGGTNDTGETYTNNEWIHLKSEYVSGVTNKLYRNGALIYTEGSPVSGTVEQVLIGVQDSEGYFDSIGIVSDGYTTGSNAKNITDTNAQYFDDTPDTYQISSATVIGGYYKGAKLTYTAYATTSVSNEGIQVYRPDLKTQATVTSLAQKIVARNDVENHILSCDLSGQTQLDIQGTYLVENSSPYNFTEAACFLQYNDYDVLAKKNNPVLYKYFTLKQSKGEQESGDITPRKNFQAIGSTQKSVNSSAGDGITPSIITVDADEDYGKGTGNFDELLTGWTGYTHANSIKTYHAELLGKKHVLELMAGDTSEILKKTFTSTQTIYVSSWMRAEDISVNKYIFLINDAETNILAGFNMSSTGVWLIYQNTAFIALQNDVPLVVDTWYHLTFYYDGVNVTYWINGKLVYFNTTTQSDPATKLRHQSNENNDGNSWFSCATYSGDDLAIALSSLTDATAILKTLVVNGCPNPWEWVIRDISDASPDWDDTDMAAAGDDTSFHDWDISAIVGARKCVVFIHADVQDNVSGSEVYIRPKGYTLEGMDIADSLVANKHQSNGHLYITDENGVLELKSDPAPSSWTEIELFIHMFRCY